MKWNSNFHTFVGIFMLVFVSLLIGCAPAVEPPQPSLPSAIQIFYKLDQWLLGTTYGDQWVSSPGYGPLRQPGNSYVVEVRAEVLNANGQPMLASIEWIPDDPDMIRVSPDHGSQVTIMILHPGESHLTVRAQNVSKLLVIKATQVNNTGIEVEIATLEGAG